jgi:CubicO group peptidase (beta-lactamase class C family)
MVDIVTEVDLEFSWRARSGCLWSVLSFILIVLMALLAPVQIRAQSSLVPVIDAKAIESFIAEQLRYTSIPGVSIAITFGNEIIYLDGMGHDSSKAAMTPQTSLYVGSLSKAFTGFALLQLAEAGLIDLDRPVQDYLPEFVIGDPRGARITPRHLVRHTSGLTDRHNSEWGWPQATSLESAVARLHTTRLSIDPGTQISYHNPNYHVAARLVEVVSGQTFANYLEEQIFEPLGMINTRTVDWMDEPRDGAAYGHIFAFGKAFAAPGPDFFINGAGGLISTAQDMAAWLIMHANHGMGANGVRLLSEATMREIQVPPSVVTPGIAYDYQFGWALTPARSPPISQDGGLPTYSAHIGFEPEGGLGIVVLTNAAPPNASWDEAARTIALGVRAILRGEDPTANGLRTGVIFDYSLSAVALLVLIASVVNCRRARVWAVRFHQLPTWRMAVNLGKHVVVIALLLIGIPMLVSLVESWSWIWMAYYSPVYVAASALIVLASGGLLIARILALSGNRIASESALYGQER